MLKDEFSQAILKAKATPYSVVAAIPAFNEEKTIGSVVLLARQHADVVVVVDDGSRDRTAMIAERAGASVIRHQRNQGYGAALRSCFDFGRACGCEVLVVLDGDGQHRPDMISKVIEPVAAGTADVSIGSRLMTSESAAQIPRYRRFGIRLLTRLTNLGSGNRTKVKDAQSGFRAYSRKAVELIDPREPNMGASAEILLVARKNGLSIIEVPIVADYDVDGSTKGPLVHGLTVIASIIRYVETEHPLLAFGVPGFVLLAIGLLLGFQLLGVYNSTSVLSLSQALEAVMLVVLGSMLGLTGLILHAVIAAARRFR